MNAQEFYEKNLPIIQSINDNDIVGLSMPQEQAATESEQLLLVATNHKDLLTARGLNPVFIDTLEERAGTFAYAAVNFDINTKKVSVFKELWNEKSDIAYNLRRKIINEFDFAFRKNNEAIENLKEVKKGRGDKDMVLDLLAVYALGKKFPSELEAISFDLTLLEQAKTLHEEVSEAYAEAMIYDDAINEARVIRDKAYTWLKEAMDEIREYGKFVFQDDPEKQKNYFSEYFTNIGKDSSKNRIGNSETFDTIIAN